MLEYYRMYMFFFVLFVVVCASCMYALCWHIHMMPDAISSTIAVLQSICPFVRVFFLSLVSSLLSVRFNFIYIAIKKNTHTHTIAHLWCMLSGLKCMCLCGVFLFVFASVHILWFLPDWITIPYTITYQTHMKSNYVESMFG